MMMLDLFFGSFLKLPPQIPLTRVITMHSLTTHTTTITALSHTTTDWPRSPVDRWWTWKNASSTTWPTRRLTRSQMSTRSQMPTNRLRDSHQGGTIAERGADSRLCLMLIARLIPVPNNDSKIIRIPQCFLPLTIQSLCAWQALTAATETALGKQLSEHFTELFELLQLVECPCLL